MIVLNCARFARVSVIAVAGLVLAGCMSDGSQSDSRPNADTAINFVQSAGEHGTLTVKSSSGGASEPGKVRVCLTNQTKRDKGMHWKTGEIPRYIAEQGKTSCGNHPPRSIVWHMSRKTRAVLGVGAYWRQTAPVAIDYTALAGNTVTITWTE